MKIIKFNSFPENPSNPARVNMETGVIDVNLSAFDLLPEYAQEFVLYHEQGHYKLQTADERRADDYALSQMALAKEYSLKHHVDSVYMLARDDEKRKHHALISVLKVMAKLGDKKAIELLKQEKNG